VARLVSWSFSAFAALSAVHRRREAMTSQFPEWFEPMAATLTQARFTGPEWIFERKLDGIRLLTFKQGSDVRLFSRNRLPQNDSYPAVVRAVAQLPVREVVLDGEATGHWGKSSENGYHVFDILWLEGRRVTSLPLEERRALLQRLPLEPPLLRVAALDDPKPWERACQEGWEGVIAAARRTNIGARRTG
jgi:bifunctional non-homologous end joining protein LigD